MDEPLIVGVDIGGTKTHVRAARGSRTTVDRVVATDSWRVRNTDSDARAFFVLLGSITQDASPAALAVGAHGCDNDANCRAFEQALARETGARVQVVNDAELMVPAAGFRDGIGVVAGTGSIAVARDAAGAMLAAGGWGWILGDEGSASALVREAARMVRRALDRDDRADPLIDALMSAFGIDDPTRLGRLLDATRGAAAWGRHADAVFRAAEAGSALASTVIREGGEGLAALVGVLIGRGAAAGRVVAGGSVIVQQPALLQAFEAALREVSPATQVTLLRESPVAGAVALAQRLLGTAAPVR